MQRIFKQMEFLRRNVPLCQQKRFLPLFIFTDVCHKDDMPQAAILF